MASRSKWLFLLLSCVASTEVLGYIIMRPSCATGWFYYKSNCYGYFRKLRSWPDAELECQSYGSGSHLASVHNLKEAKTLAMFISGYQKNRPVWIGLHDPQKKQQWEWIDGSEYSYKAWLGRSVDRDKDCAEMNYKSNFLTWNSRPCNKRQHFLCKYRP
ncbi:regenerating islet-derived protein 4 [Erinaceus europaeus]|uniref:Regenerating islet-derived protein 4 n=1 Tax=Erinaceus europaeus TaxID=9365 RepID=A0A1S2ZUF2_ERIEU|nr:regenerating islet-derived protein 4 [Erinaceus europaeus]XP_060056977.1 regenerating islet-derived protein 4 [Erinaceus europaeus]